jgi:thioredoxin-related protein
MSKKSIVAIVLGAFLGIFVYKALQHTAPVQIENAPQWRALDKGLEEASKKDKLVLVDVYEDGCKYCRAMEREVYPDSTVRAVLDAGYIPVKINGNADEPITWKGESVSSRSWAQQQGVFVFPGTLILDAQGNLLKRRTGFMNADELRQFMYR